MHIVSTYNFNCSFHCQSIVERVAVFQTIAHWRRHDFEFYFDVIRLNFQLDHSDFYSRHSVRERPHYSNLYWFDTFSSSRSISSLWVRFSSALLFTSANAKLTTFPKNLRTFNSLEGNFLWDGRRKKNLSTRQGRHNARREVMHGTLAIMKTRPFFCESSFQKGKWKALKLRNLFLTLGRLKRRQENAKYCMSAKQNSEPNLTLGVKQLKNFKTLWRSSPESCVTTINGSHQGESPKRQEQNLFPNVSKQEILKRFTLHHNWNYEMNVKRC